MLAGSGQSKRVGMPNIGLHDVPACFRPTLCWQHCTEVLQYFMYWHSTDDSSNNQDPLSFYIPKSVLLLTPAALYGRYQAVACPTPPRAT